MLAKRPDLQVVAEVSNGLEAVQKAEELKPDLILLDVGLPGMNGIDAAREIRKLVPESKIVFPQTESLLHNVSSRLLTQGLRDML